ncbi:MAG: MoaD/ThiS family protein [Bacillota bacterium]
MERGLIIHLEVYLPFRGKRRWVGEESLPTGMTAGGLVAHLGLTEPELVVLVGGRYVAPETPLQEGAQVAILRQAEGG